MDQPAVTHFLTTLSPGDIVHGTVARIENFGVFVDLDHAPVPEIGFVPPPELSWMWISSAHEVVTAGQRVSAEVLAIDIDFRGQAALSLRALHPNPWTAWASREGDLVTGRVHRTIEALGAFIELAEGITGLLPHHTLPEGRELTVRIAEVDVAHRRIRLSLPDAGNPVASR
ncbi:S1 RNA-binding domain-containing protein [Actinoplanes sp. G11-F43]|uniref:S1 RNA-binding domain-containing protein n=1 Tax=Actinoplanes sp. G11-F43 TaxID=3424130 RepID=UPI003D346526